MEKVNRVLIVTITNVKLPVAADVLHTVFYKYGDVLRIICFPRQLGYQALVEMAGLDSAKAAKKELQGTSMYLSADVNVMMKI